MGKKTNTKKDAGVRNESRGNGKSKKGTWKNYGRFVINQTLDSRVQIDRLWNAVVELQSEVGRLQSNNGGGQ
jgi:hypothetical protein